MGGCDRARRYSARETWDKPYAVTAPTPDMGPPWMGNGLQSCPVDLGEMHRAVDLLASPSGEHVEHAVRELREGLRIALGEPEGVMSNGS